jgi:diguanylate cyclase (GGDEF)-like protein
MSVLSSFPPNDTRLDPAALSRLLPMHLRLSQGGAVTGFGPTLGKLMGLHAPVAEPFFDLFEVRRPADVQDIAGLGRTGQKLHLRPHRFPAMRFRGLAVPLTAGEGVLLNLSFGIGLADAVRNHDLTDADFAPTDLAMELLYLIEAKNAVVTELRDLNRRLAGAKTMAEEQAQTDTLTGLRNRRALDLALADMVVRDAPFGLMHIDLDFFKAVNDTLGHAAGDHVLQEVARVLRNHTRDGDTVARVGGDEFIILTPGLVDAVRLTAIASRIITQLDAPILFGGQECRVSASIGMTVSTTSPPAQPDHMLRDADEALYEAKRAGRGRAVFRSYSD